MIRFCPLGDYLRIEHGFAFKGEFFSEIGHFVLLTPGNFYDGGGFRLRPGKDRYYVGEIPQRYILNQGDVIVAMTEQAEGLLGSSALIPEANKYLHNQRLGLVKVKIGKADGRFLYHLFNISLVRQQIRGSSSGTKVRHTSPERMYKVHVPLFPIEIQIKIASILSAYDDLIENNKRRIAILEKMAEEIYREWFVRMRFSSYASDFAKATSDKKAKVDSTGLPCLPKDIPANLGKISSLRDFATFYKGKNPESTSTEENEDSLPYIMVESLENGQQLFAKKKNNSVIAHHNEILMLMDGARSGLVFRSPGGIVGSTFAVLRTHPLLVNFLFEFLKATQKSIVSNNTGSAIPHANKEFIHRMQVALPEASVLLTFNSVYGPIDLLKANLKLQNEKLVRSRDLLLPRLISGKLSVEDLELPTNEKLTAVSSALTQEELAHA